MVVSLRLTTLYWLMVLWLVSFLHLEDSDKTAPYYFLSLYPCS